MWPRWVRGVFALWVAYDSNRRGGFSLFWFIFLLIFGPFLFPVYLTLRTLIPGEDYPDSNFRFFWENLKTFFATLISCASFAIFAENLEKVINADLGKVKRAELLAGSIFSFVLLNACLWIFRSFSSCCSSKIS
ncbi:MAG: hypothetical protein HQM08_02480 [Candidatus Riflebacteria bacterium]|nr:hypothetical protein [Candidatus Riflebacteria bacterium]